MHSTQSDPFVRAKAFVAEAFVWDNHTCLPLRPHDTKFLPQLWRHKEAGFDAVNVNIGCLGQGIEEHVRMLAHFSAWFAAHGDRFVLLRDPHDLERARSSGRLAVAFDIEGADAIEDQPSMIRLYRDLGVQWMSVAYNTNNRVGGGCQDEDTGLTPFGRQVIREMESVQLTVCLSHTGHRTAREVLEMAARPVIFSHSNCAALWQHPRNIPDDLIRGCAKTGGLVGINGIGIFLGENDNSSERYARHVDHVVQLVGPEHVAISLDYVFDSAELDEYLETMRHTFPAGLGYDRGIRMVAPEQLAEIVAILQGWGYSDEALHAILGGNLRRVRFGASKTTH